MSGDPKQDHIDRVYILILQWECACFFQSLSLADQLIANRNLDFAFGQLQSALAFAANIAKTLYGKSARHHEKAAAEARASRLQKLLALGSDAVLENVDIRNDIEHLDVRIDEWVMKSQQHIFSTFNVAPIDAIKVDHTDQFMQYDRGAAKILMLDHVVDLNALSESVQKVYAAASGWRP